ncbi:carboxypeptidase-like regulatory domain-containing protein [Snuella sedimenti]|uniref:Carboxypeptidase-like regulatory domain-containing protein n=1 Tax=Snuella sedimenti TaxID=2798802 RepID=A0A8J7LUE2_9FLAO|nr:carboxypeptidase-like regulatory domain-containing protein [Snuella sedimenti]MBJ6369645.1 carboxypeptidase-like regulatory domain-containing protein [Snuella sedimenti]
MKHRLLLLDNRDLKYLVGFPRGSILLLLFSSLSIFGQTKERVDIQGRIFSEVNDIEGVTIYNTSSNKGTITNKDGKFTIAVTMNDIIEISALQFETVSITIDEAIVMSKTLKVQLIEQLNKLEAVTLNSGLTGNLAEDINNVKTPPKLSIDLGNMDAQELSDDQYSKVENEIMQKGQLKNGVNFIALYKMLVQPLLKSKKKETKSTKVAPKSFSKTITDICPESLISEATGIPIENIELFLTYIEEKGVSQDLLGSKNKMELLEYLIQQGERFSKIKTEEHQK